MKLTTALITLSATIASVVASQMLEERATAHPKGIDISHFQSDVDLNKVKANGISFVYIKATEGQTYTDPSFSQHYSGATKAGLLRGGYHFAHPDSSSGVAQAKFFLAHGGSWSKDGRTLPGALDIEYNPARGGKECYGLSKSAMVSWIKDFSDTYHSTTGIYPVIYTTTDWWTTCTGNSAAFGSANPLWIAHYASSIGALPAGWNFATFWQYADKGPNPGDHNEFNGTLEGLHKIALN